MAAVHVRYVRDLVLDRCCGARLPRLPVTSLFAAADTNWGLMLKRQTGKTPTEVGAFAGCLSQGSYFSEVLIDENELLSVVPRPLTAPMMARAIPAAISAYSIAVAADWSAKKR